MKLEVLLCCSYKEYSEQTINFLYLLETAPVIDELNSGPLPQEQIQQKGWEGYQVFCQKRGINQKTGVDVKMGGCHLCITLQVNHIYSLRVWRGKVQFPLNFKYNKTKLALYLSQNFKAMVQHLIKVCPSCVTHVGLKWNIYLSLYQGKFENKIKLLCWTLF